MKQRLVLIFFWLVIALLSGVILFWMAVAILFNINRATVIALAYDRLGNVAMGQGNETISSWAGKRNSWLEKPINFLFKILTGEVNHCDNSKEAQNM